jgi:uncharacterized protein (TIGR00288 family)
VAEADRSLAVFIDFENLALGFQGRRDRFDISRVLERLVEKGKIVVKKAYADWHRYSAFTHALHESAIELIEIPNRRQGGKNSADIRLCVDAMDLAYSKEHINTFVVVSGDSDFSPLVSKLKELGKHVIGLGMHDSTSDLLRDNCDEFIYYEDLGADETLPPEIDRQLPESKQKAFALLLDALMALRRENKEVLWASMIKDTIKRKKPSFNETYHHYRTFGELLEDAQREGLLELETDKRSRTYVVTRFGQEMQAPREAAHAAEVAATEAGSMIVSQAVQVPDSAVSAELEPGAAAAMAPGGLPPRKKSRRRRRRGKGGAENGGNGLHGPMISYGPGYGPGAGPGAPAVPISPPRITVADPLPVVVIPPRAAEPPEPAAPSPAPEPAPVEAPPAKATRARKSASTGTTRARKTTATARTRKKAADASEEASAEK